MATESVELAQLQTTFQLRRLAIVVAIGVLIAVFVFVKTKTLSAEWLAVAFLWLKK